MTLERSEIRRRLEELAEPGYRDFNCKLLPGVEDMLGVRTPALRRLAREIAKGDWRGYVDQVRTAWQQGEACHEERLLWGMVVGAGAGAWEEAAAYIRDFVPVIDNWAVCDSFCGTLKIARKHKAEMWELLAPYLDSELEYECRFGAVMLLDYFIDEDYVDRALGALDRIRSQAYYSKMAVAWAVSIFYVKMPERVMPYLEKNHLDDWTYNKALQKICESLRIDGQTRAVIRSMKRQAGPAGGIDRREMP